MSQPVDSPHGVMEGRGSYNLHATVPAGGAVLALPFLEQAIRHMALEAGNRPIVIGDYGSSQGKNSLEPMLTAIRSFRGRVGQDRPILVVHVDQHANDFNTLFEVLHADPARYSADDPNVFPSAIGRSFYEQVFPPGYVHLAWSSYAVVWLRRVPMPVPGHFMGQASTGAVREAFERQAAEDWQFFLSLRATELVAGGRLVVVLPGLNDDGRSGFEPLFRHANDALTELIAEGAITQDDRARMVLGAYPRRTNQLLAPFQSRGEFRQLTVDHCELFPLPDAAWLDYERDHEKERLAHRHANFFRAVFVPSLAGAIPEGPSRDAFPDRLTEKLKQHISHHPAPLHSFVQTIVLGKKNSTDTHGVQG